MFNNFFYLFKYSDLRQKLFFTFFFIIIYRFGSHIPLFGVNLNELEKFFSSNQALGFFDLFSGGNLSKFSIFSLGIIPYINSSIIIQLLTIIFPKLKEASEEGDSGRKLLSQYTRYLTVFIALIQSVVLILNFRNFISTEISFLTFFLYSVIVLVAGSIFIMWIGELITVYGIGNGSSLLIFIGIVSQMPFYFKNTFILIKTGFSLFSILALFFVFLIIIFLIVQVQEAERKVYINYARKIVSDKIYSIPNNFIPFKLIQGGVMPVIFSSALLQFPLIIFQYFFSNSIQSFFLSFYHHNSFIYNLFFCFLIFFFAYFYTAVTFNPFDLSDNIKKQGGFIPGVRPGQNTISYFENIVSRLTFMGAFFLSFVAIIPVLAANFTKVHTFMGLGGTAFLIMVGVALDIMRQIDVYIISKKYDGFLKQ